VIVYRFNSPLVFSNSEAFKQGGEKILIQAANDGGLPKTLVVDCEEMFEVDTTGAAAVTSLLHYARRFNVDLALSRVHSDARQILEAEGLIKELGEDHVYDTVRLAVEAVSGEPVHAGGG